MKKNDKKQPVQRPVILAGLTLAVVLFSYAFLTSSPGVLVRAPGLLASAVVGMSAGVPANPDNTLALQLKQKEVELDEREASLAGAEALMRGDTLTFSDRMALYSFGASLTLFFLVGLNYYFDWRRNRTRSVPVS